MMFRIASRLALGAVLMTLAAPTSASAQNLLSGFLPEPAGTCTCAVVEPPNNCAAAMSSARSQAQTGRAEVRRQCASDWQAGCEEQLGWRQCASEEALAQKASQCDGLAEQWWSQVATPQISQVRGQCNAANAGWAQQCETVTRPRSCATCDDMVAELAELRTRLNDHRAWIAVIRSGEAIVTPSDEAQMSQRLEDVRIWENQLASKQAGYASLQDTQFCPIQIGRAHV